MGKDTLLIICRTSGAQFDLLVAIAFEILGCSQDGSVDSRYSIRSLRSWPSLEDEPAAISGPSLLFSSSDLVFI